MSIDFQGVKAGLEASAHKVTVRGLTRPVFLEVECATRYQLVVGFYEDRFVILYGPWTKENRQGHFPVPTVDQPEVAKYVAEFIRRRTEFESKGGHQ